MMKIKQKKLVLNHEEEFSLMKLVLDKILWIGTVITLFGLYQLVNPKTSIEFGLVTVATGVFMFFVFTAILAKNVEYKSK